MSMRATPAAGRLFMDGGTYTKADYPLLYKLIQDSPAYGTTGGSAGSETFTLADMRERMPFGKSQNAPWATLGGKGGATSHTHDSGSYGANIQIFWQPNTLYMDFEAASTPAHTETRRTTVNSAGSDNAFSESGTSAVKVGGTSGSSSSMSPYILVNYEIIAG